MQYFIKHFFILLVSIYIYYKLLNKKFPKQLLSYIYVLLFAFISSFIIVVFFDSYKKVIPLFEIVSLFLYHIFFSKDKIDTSFLTSITAFGISYIFFVISAIINAFLYKIIINEDSPNFIMLQLLISILQILFSILLFKVKRLRKGMPFLSNKKDMSYIVFLCMLVIFIDIILTSNSDKKINVILITVALLFLVQVLFSWQKYITSDYVNKLNARNIRILEEQIQSQSKLIKELTTDRDSMASLIHKDNKIIPAMQLSVEEYLSHPAPEKKVGETLIHNLRQLYADRVGILESFNENNALSIQLSVASTNSLLRYFYQRSQNQNINFEVVNTIDPEFLLNGIISESDLNTILADLIENALISASFTTIKKVKVVFNQINNIYTICILDSGESFDPKVLKSLGTKKITTHKDTGGSGIGLYSTYHLLQKYNASFSIQEISEDAYTKKISVIFDNCNLISLNIS